ncbi:hypothetical protein B0A55_00102 [Friedmanniomyces simplex]|uniref:Uncharacterized protein n=1 Tax=Friedmanniomyces simplex TaxID=329884 RepID=A0A4V5NIP0_9PEZI|nr:hypothetical protein B0A55_00102 [Friedmanniomyces simplex]
MKLASSLILPALSWSVRLASASSEGRVYICDGQPAAATAPRSRTLSPTEARLVIAQRAGVEDYHNADLKDGGALEAINEFGRRTSLFGDVAEEKLVEAVVLVEGGKDVRVPPTQQCRSFAISPAPDAASTRGLWVDLVRQASPLVYSSDVTEETILALLRGEGMADGHGKTFRITSRTEDLLSLMDPKQRDVSSTIVIPPTTWNSETDGQWGTYPMPSFQSPLRKRSSRSPPQPEAPLEIDPITSFQPVESSTNTPSSDFFTSAANNNTNTSTPLPGILPACFPTQQSCESTTRSCMGHGACQLAYTDQSASAQSPSQHCYACLCSPTITKSSDGKLVTTTYWGGPACQKKDISVEFWMLALFSVGLVFLVSFAIGELVGMGGEELPGVIGAGVSGPTAKR